MPLTLGLTGMDPATETALKAAFSDANARLSGHWRLMPESEAEHVMVDMDSMYGPMSWLRLHAAGKSVIGLTSAPRTQTDYRLGRPFNSDSFAELLRSVASGNGQELPLSEKRGATAPPRDATRTAPVAAVVAGKTSSSESTRSTQPEAAEPQIAALEVASPPAFEPPAPIQQTPLPTVAATKKTPPPVVTEPAPVAAPVVAVFEAKPVKPVAAAKPVAPVAPAAPVSSRAMTLAQWLVPDALVRPTRYRRASGPTLWIHPATRSYHGPTTLKPFADYFTGAVGGEDFETVDEATWLRESAAAGAAQPLVRLQWLGGLVAGKGALLPGYDPDGRYRLTKWPQTEREYPKHFRIATAMMKGPATLAEIAAASTIPLADVSDFVNANLVTGFAEFVPEPPPEPAEPAKSTGLLGRLRGGR